MSTGVINIADKFGNLQQISVEVVGSVLTPHSVPEVAGSPVTSLNPMPTSNATANAALGAPSDTGWSGSGSSTVVAALKALWTALTGTLTIKHATATPTAGSNAVVSTGGTAVIAITGPVRGGYIVNPENASDQAISVVEQLLVDPVGTPSSSSGNGNGTTASLDPGQVWTLPCAIPSGVTVKVNAVTSGHKFTVVVWN